MNYQEDNPITEHLHQLLINDSYNEICGVVEKITDDERTPEQIRCHVTALCFMGSLEKARIELDKVRIACEPVAQWHMLYGYSFYKEGRYEQAIPYLERVSGLEPCDTDCLHLLIECWQNLGKTHMVKQLKKRIAEINRC